jgi:5-methylcytosine-specific restriction enzyme subunit McrC
MDTKWKILSDAKANYGISQADMYQMYAYQKKYSSENVTLLYPKTENISREDIGFSSDDGVIVRVRFVDLFDIKGFIENFAV